MNRLPLDKRARILHLLVQGYSIQATTRIMAVSKNTVAKLLSDAGSQCLDFQDEVLRDLPCKRLRCGKIWSISYGQRPNAPEDKKGQPGNGDVWTWTALCADTKIVPCWHIGQRTTADAELFIGDLANRLSTHLQLTTNGDKAHLNAVEDVFGSEIDYGMLVKLYGPSREAERRYNPTAGTGTEKRVIPGKSDRNEALTTYVERQNLSMRTGMRQFTRLTNSFSKKVENFAHAVSLHYMYYNFARIHQSLRVTPAMAAGVSSHVWKIEEVAALNE